ncbi:MAG: glutamate racemase [Desulfotomaculum sp.]|nr:glutamate racemase [Desulfotomaculum sp.]
MSNTSPIGIFDSGIGGLSIAKEIRKLLPAEDLLYYADSAYCPYGDKPAKIIKQRVFTVGDFLLTRGAKLLVVACNTASIISLDDLRQHYQVPVVGVEPAVKPAVAATKTGTIGVLATGVSLSGNRFSTLVKRFCLQTKVVTQPCPGLVELVESGQFNSPQAEKLLFTYLKPLLKHNIDTIVLGCTHYPFLRPLIQKITSEDIQIIDTGEAVARQTVRVLTKMNLANKQNKLGQELFFTSGKVKIVEPVVQLLWGDYTLKINVSKTFP